MKISVLGSGGWEGIPSPFCTCSVCTVAAASPQSRDSRTRPGFFVETAAGAFGIEVSPDIRLQSTRWNLPVISDFLISHWHFDHAYGLYELDTYSKRQIPNGLQLYCSTATAEKISRTFAHIKLNTEILRPFSPVDLKGIQITPFPVLHMRSSDTREPEKSNDNVFGFLLDDKKRKVAYLADYYDIPKASFDLIQNCDILIADGTYLFEKETSTHREDSDHLHDEDIIRLVKSLGCERSIFFSVTHCSGMQDLEMSKLLPTGMELAYDGQILLE